MVHKFNSQIHVRIKEYLNHSSEHLIFVPPYKQSAICIYLSKVSSHQIPTDNAPERVEVSYKSLSSREQGEKYGHQGYSLFQASMEIGGDILQDSKCKSTSCILLDTLWIFKSKAYECCLTCKSPVFVHINSGTGLMEHPNSIIVGNNTEF